MTSSTPFFSLDWYDSIIIIVVKAGSSESGDMGSNESNLAWCWTSLLPSAILRGTEPVTALTRCCVTRAFILRLWQSRADRVLSLTWTSDFHCFGALGVGPGGLTRPHIRTWPMGMIIAMSKGLAIVFPSIVKNTWKIMAHSECFSTLKLTFTTIRKQIYSRSSSEAQSKIYCLISVVLLFSWPPDL